MSRTLRFCLVTTFYPPHHFGGDGVLVYRLASALARRHHEVDVIYCVDSYRLFNRAPPPRHPPDHPNVRVHALRSRLGPLSPVYTHQTGRPGPKRRGLTRILEDHAFDVIHYHNISLVGGPAVIALGRAAVRLFTAHDYWPVCPLSTLWQYGRRICTNRQCIRCGLHAGRPPQAWRATGLLARALKRIDAFLCPSVFVMQILRDHGLDLPYTHLPNFVSEPERIALDEAVAAMGPRYFLYAGRIEKHKGADDAVAVFRHHDASALWIAGEGNHEARLRRRAGGAPHIRFLGHQPRDALFALYRGAQAVIVPSWWHEPFGMIAIEAWAASTPVIARRAGALEELVRTSGGGILYEDEAGLREAIRSLENNPRMRDQLAARGHAAFRAQWTEEKHLERYFALLAQLGVSP